MKPIIKLKSAKKVINYFYAEEYQKYKAIIVGIRNENGKNKINLFDDESCTLITATDELITNNFNTDPSIYREAGRGVAILRPGVHPYTISFHHTNNDRKRYVALRPKTPGEYLPVFYYNERGVLRLRLGQAINIHAGGDITTGSRGCQTFPKRQYYGWLDFIAKPFGLKVPRGICTRKNIGAELFDRLKKGVGEIPYILVTQEQFDYIMNLPESEFDSPADLKYQLENFVNIPKIKPVVPTLPPARNPEEIFDEDDTKDFPPDVLLQDEENGGESNDFVSNVIEDFTKPVGEQIGAVTQTVTEKIDDGTKQIEKTTTEITDKFSPQNIPAYIPRFGIKNWLLGLIPAGGFFSTIFAYIENAPNWLIFVLGFITGVTAYGFFQLLMKHREKVVDFISMCYQSLSNPNTHNLIPTDAAKVLGGGWFGTLQASRRESLEQALNEQES